MVAIDTICGGAIPPSLSRQKKRRFFRALLDWIIVCGQKRRSRLALSEMSPEQLLDIGVTADEARQEAARPFWN
ncbi:DUF1127 domain-containing protein [Pararhizobium arenae]|uniref:DUF1127 domain-containing protein n=1 Tax=Pararhizobium arenae TaxID=1856850 RepID=UPI00117AC235|nr:DUF1127 domain-containing protein [Pararhizobium arenae]